MSFKQNGLIIPAAAINPGTDWEAMRALGVYPGLGGSERGYNASGDIVSRTIDGVDFNDLWAEYQRTLQLANSGRQRIIDFLTFPVTREIERVAQGGSGTDFEIATEYGEPVGTRASVNYFNMAYDIERYDLAVRYTWEFLVQSDSEQVNAIHASVLEADNRNIFNKVMRTIFNNSNVVTSINGSPYNVYKFYNNDGTTPPAYKSNTFLSTHNHYITSGAATLDSKDVEDIQDDLYKHGYTGSSGYRLVLMVNKAQGDVIRTWRFNQTNANGAVAKFDFIPARGREDLLFLSNTQVLGNQPAANLGGMDVIGAYGDFLIVQEDYVPAGYMAAFATGGEANLGNPVGFRESNIPALRGLRMVQGNTLNYPLIDSYYQRMFGTGIRQRGGGFVMQVTANANYAPPALYA